MRNVNEILRSQIVTSKGTATPETLPEMTPETAPEATVEATEMVQAFNSLEF